MSGYTTRTRGAYNQGRMVLIRPALLALILTMVSGQALAHIKWFAHVQLQQAPRAPWQLWQEGFGFAGLSLMAIVVMSLVAMLDARLSRRSKPAAVPLGDDTLTAVRLACSVFFAANAAYFMDTPVILTPELHTQQAWVPVVQWLIAVTAATGHGRLAALGVLSLYGEGLAQYGLFHMLDYVLFPGLALCLWWSQARRPRHVQALLILRWALGWSLLWGAAEKWLYPEWTYPLLCGDGRSLLMGLSPAFFMQGAGFIEFCAAFALIYGAVASRVASLLLIGLMCAAMPMFGFIDVIGHAPFIVALAALASCRHNPLADAHLPSTPWRYALRWAGLLLLILPTLLFAYYLAHEMLWDLRDLSFLPCAMALPLLLLLADARQLPDILRRHQASTQVATQVSMH